LRVMRGPTKTSGGLVWKIIRVAQEVVPRSAPMGGEEASYSTTRITPVKTSDPKGGVLRGARLLGQRQDPSDLQWQASAGKRQRGSNHVETFHSHEGGDSRLFHELGEKGKCHGRKAAVRRRSRSWGKYRRSIEGRTCGRGVRDIIKKDRITREIGGLYRMGGY